MDRKTLHTPILVIFLSYCNITERTFRKVPMACGNMGTFHVGLHICPWLCEQRGFAKNVPHLQSEDKRKWTFWLNKSVSRATMAEKKRHNLCRETEAGNAELASNFECTGPTQQPCLDKNQNQNQKSFNVPQMGNVFVAAMSECYKNGAIAK